MSNIFRKHSTEGNIIQTSSVEEDFIAYVMSAHLGLQTSLDNGALSAESTDYVVGTFANNVVDTGTSANRSNISVSYLWEATLDSANDINTIDQSLTDFGVEGSYERDSFGTTSSSKTVSEDTVYFNLMTNGDIWTEEKAELLAADGFGEKSAVNEDWLVMWDPGTYVPRGQGPRTTQMPSSKYSVIVLNRNTNISYRIWDPESLNGTVEVKSLFGVTLSVFGDKLCIGSPWINPYFHGSGNDGSHPITEQPNEHGRVYVYDLSGATPNLEHTLENPHSFYYTSSTGTEVAAGLGIDVIHNSNYLITGIVKGPAETPGITRSYSLGTGAGNMGFSVYDVNTGVRLVDFVQLYNNASFTPNQCNFNRKFNDENVLFVNLKDTSTPRLYVHNIGSTPSSITQDKLINTDFTSPTNPSGVWDYHRHEYDFSIDGSDASGGYHLTVYNDGFLTHPTYGPIRGLVSIFKIGTSYPRKSGITFVADIINIDGIGSQTYAGWAAAGFVKHLDLANDSIWIGIDDGNGGGIREIGISGPQQNQIKRIIQSSPVTNWNYPDNNNRDLEKEEFCKITIPQGPLGNTTFVTKRGATGASVYSRDFVSLGQLLQAKFTVGDKLLLTAAVSVDSPTNEFYDAVGFIFTSTLDGVVNDGVLINKLTDFSQPSSNLANTIDNNVIAFDGSNFNSFFAKFEIVFTKNGLFSFDVTAYNVKADDINSLPWTGFSFVQDIRSYNNVPISVFDQTLNFNANYTPLYQNMKTLDYVATDFGVEAALKSTKHLPENIIHGFYPFGSHQWSIRDPHNASASNYGSSYSRWSTQTTITDGKYIFINDPNLINPNRYDGRSGGFHIYDKTTNTKIKTYVYDLFTGYGRSIGSGLYNQQFRTEIPLCGTCAFLKWNEYIITDIALSQGTNTTLYRNYMAFNYLTGRVDAIFTPPDSSSASAGEFLYSWSTIQQGFVAGEEPSRSRTVENQDWMIEISDDMLILGDYRAGLALYDLKNLYKNFEASNPEIGLGTANYKLSDSYDNVPQIDKYSYILPISEVDGGTTGSLSTYNEMNVEISDEYIVFSLPLLPDTDPLTTATLPTGLIKVYDRNLLFNGITPGNNAALDVSGALLHTIHRPSDFALEYLSRWARVTWLEPSNNILHVIEYEQGILGNFESLTYDLPNLVGSDIYSASGTGLDPLGSGFPNTPDQINPQGTENYYPLNKVTGLGEIVVKKYGNQIPNYLIALHPYANEWTTSANVGNQCYGFMTMWNATTGRCDYVFAMEDPEFQYPGSLNFNAINVGDDLDTITCSTGSNFFHGNETLDFGSNSITGAQYGDATLYNPGLESGNPTYPIQAQNASKVLKFKFSDLPTATGTYQLMTKANIPNLEIIRAPEETFINPIYPQVDTSALQLKMTCNNDYILAGHQIPDNTRSASNHNSNISFFLDKDTPNTLLSPKDMSIAEVYDWDGNVVYQIGGLSSLMRSEIAYYAPSPSIWSGKLLVWHCEINREGTTNEIVIHFALDKLTTTAEQWDDASWILVIDLDLLPSYQGSPIFVDASTLTHGLLLSARNALGNPFVNSSESLTRAVFIDDNYIAVHRKDTSISHPPARGNVRGQWYVWIRSNITPNVGSITTLDSQCDFVLESPTDISLVGDGAQSGYTVKSTSTSTMAAGKIIEGNWQANKNYPTSTDNHGAVIVYDLDAAAATISTPQQQTLIYGNFTIIYPEDLPDVIAGSSVLGSSNGRFGWSVSASAAQNAILVSSTIDAITTQSSSILMFRLDTLEFVRDITPLEYETQTFPAVVERPDHSIADNGLVSMGRGRPYITTITPYYDWPQVIVDLNSTVGGYADTKYQIPIIEYREIFKQLIDKFPDDNWSITQFSDNSLWTGSLIKPDGTRVILHNTEFELIGPAGSNTSTNSNTPADAGVFIIQDIIPVEADYKNDVNWKPPVTWEDTLNVIKEMSPTELENYVEKLLTIVLENEWGGSYRLSSFQPGDGWIELIPDIFTDTRTDGTITSYSIWLKQSINPTLIPDGDTRYLTTHFNGTGVFDAIQETTFDQMKYSLGEAAKSYVSRSTSNIGVYQLRSSVQGRPTDPGIWVARGVAVDTVNASFLDIEEPQSYMGTVTSTYDTDYVQTRFEAYDGQAYDHQYDGTIFADYSTGPVDKLVFSDYSTGPVDKTAFASYSTGPVDKLVFASYSTGPVSKPFTRQYFGTPYTSTFTRANLGLPYTSTFTRTNLGLPYTSTFTRTNLGLPYTSTFTRPFTHPISTHPNNMLVTTLLDKPGTFSVLITETNGGAPATWPSSIQLGDKLRLQTTTRITTAPGEQFEALAHQVSWQWTAGGTSNNQGANVFIVGAPQTSPALQIENGRFATWSNNITGNGTSGTDRIVTWDITPTVTGTMTIDHFVRIDDTDWGSFPDFRSATANNYATIIVGPAGSGSSGPVNKTVFSSYSTSPVNKTVFSSYSTSPVNKTVFSSYSTGPVSKPFTRQYFGTPYTSTFTRQYFGTPYTSTFTRQYFGTPYTSTFTRQYFGASYTSTFTRPNFGANYTSTFTRANLGLPYTSTFTRPNLGLPYTSTFTRPSAGGFYTSTFDRPNFGTAYTSTFTRPNFGADYTSTFTRPNFGAAYTSTFTRPNFGAAYTSTFTRQYFGTPYTSTFTRQYFGTPYTSTFTREYFGTPYTSTFTREYFGTPYTSTFTREYFGADYTHSSFVDYIQTNFVNFEGASYDKRYESYALAAYIGNATSDIITSTDVINLETYTLYVRTSKDTNYNLTTETNVVSETGSNGKEHFVRLTDDTSNSYNKFNAFGRSVAIDETRKRVYVGAPFYPAGNVSEGGSVQVFDPDTGERLQTLSPAGVDDGYGITILANIGGLNNVNGDYLAVAAPLYDAPGETNNGKIFFHFNVNDLLSLGGNAYEIVGNDGDYLGLSHQTTSANSRYFFSACGGNNSQYKVAMFDMAQLGSGGARREILDPDGASGDQFGNAVACNETHLAILAPYYDSTGRPNEGILYVYSLTTFTNQLPTPLYSKRYQDLRDEAFGSTVPAFRGMIAMNSTHIAVAGFSATTGSLSDPLHDNFFILDVTDGSLVHEIIDPFRTGEIVQGGVFGNNLWMNDTQVITSVYGSWARTNNRQEELFIYNVLSGELEARLENPFDGDSYYDYHGSDSVFGSKLALSNNYINVPSEREDIVQSDSSPGNVARGVVYTYPLPITQSNRVNVSVTSSNVTDETVYLDLDMGFKEVFNPSELSTDRFGGVAIGNGVYTVNAPAHNSNDGIVYVYDLESSILMRTITPPTAGQAGQFGMATEFSLNKNYLVISEPFNATAGSSPANGLVHVYSTGTWELLYTIQQNPIVDVTAVRYDTNLGLSLGVNDSYIITTMQATLNLSRNYLLVYNITNGVLMYSGTLLFNSGSGGTYDRGSRINFDVKYPNKFLIDGIPNSETYSGAFTSGNMLWVDMDQWNTYAGQTQSISGSSYCAQINKSNLLTDSRSSQYPCNVALMDDVIYFVSANSGNNYSADLTSMDLTGLTHGSSTWSSNNTGSTEFQTVSMTSGSFYQYAKDRYDENPGSNTSYLLGHNLTADPIRNTLWVTSGENYYPDETLALQMQNSLLEWDITNQEFINQIEDVTLGPIEKIRFGQVASTSTTSLAGTGVVSTRPFVVSGDKVVVTAGSIEYDTEVDADVGRVYVFDQSYSYARTRDFIPSTRRSSDRQPIRLIDGIGNYIYGIRQDKLLEGTESFKLSLWDSVSGGKRLTSDSIVYINDNSVNTLSLAKAQVNISEVSKIAFNFGDPVAHTGMQVGFGLSKDGDFVIVGSGNEYLISPSSSLPLNSWLLEKDKYEDVGLGFEAKVNSAGAGYGNTGSLYTSSSWATSFAPIIYSNAQISAVIANPAQSVSLPSGGGAGIVYSEYIAPGEVDNQVWTVRLQIRKIGSVTNDVDQLITIRSFVDISGGF